MLDFPSLFICATVGEQDEEGSPLSFLNLNYLTGVEESFVSITGRFRWFGVLARGSSPRGSWRSLYKPPIEKCRVDLQWCGHQRMVWLETDM